MELHIGLNYLYVTVAFGSDRDFGFISVTVVRIRKGAADDCLEAFKMLLISHGGDEQRLFRSHPDTLTQLLMSYQ